MAYKSGHIYVIDHEPTVEELATYSKPVEFYICKPGETEYYSILYTKSGDKFVEKASKIVTGFIKLGAITQDGNQILIGVHPSGFNHWRIGGVDVTSDQPAIIEIEPVEDGFFRLDWIVGNLAGGLFILPGQAGKTPIKPNPLNYPNLAFFMEVQVTPEAVGGLVDLNLSDVFTGNGDDTELNINEASAEKRGTMSARHWSKLEGIDLSLYASLEGLDAEIGNRAAGDSNLQQQVTTLTNQKSSVVDKMLHYWDVTLGKWLSSGIYYLSGKIGIGTTAPAESLDVNGRVKANSFIIGLNIGTAIPWEFGRQSGEVIIADASGVPMKILFLGKTFEHNIRGKVVTISSTTGTLNIDLLSGSHFNINSTTATTVSFTNMIASDETCSITLTVTGSLLTFPSWLVRDPYSDVPDASKTREYNIVIKNGGSSPSGRQMINNA